MGQPISVDEVTQLGEVLLVNADRSFSGQDGEAFTAAEETGTFPSQLAARLFGLGVGIDHVYVMSNVLSIRRPGGWDEGQLAVVTDTVENFFRFYAAPEGNQPMDSEPAES